MDQMIGNLFKPLALSNRLAFPLLLLRCVAGLAFMHHGFGKIQNPLAWMGPEAVVPSFFQAAAALSEFVGGLCWMLGLLTPLASFGIASTMAFAVWTHAVILGQPFVTKGGGSYELALLFFSIAVLLLLAGPGRFSLDRLIFGEK